MGISQMFKRVSCLKRHAKLFQTKASSVRVELVSEKIITPSSPTPKNLKQYKLSYNDQLLANQYIPITLFYPNISKSGLNSSSSSVPLLSSTLEKSLAKLLSFYYPHAGKIVHNSHVECNDKGTLFKEVRVKGSMFETLTKDFSTIQGTLFLGRHGVPWMALSESDPLAVAQLTHFACGGVAISTCVSHKITDGYAVGKFCSDWAELSRNSSSLTNPPSFTGSSLLKPKDDPFTTSMIVVGEKENLSVLRLRINSTNIKRLKDIISSESDVKDPTRFEVVAAFVNRCATIHSSFKPFTISIPMNLRNLINPNVPNLVGNLDSLLLVDVTKESDMQLPNLVTKIRKEKIKHLAKYQGKNNDEVLAQFIRDEEYVKSQTPSNLRLTSSFCTYPLYDIDFGWGRPERVTIGPVRTDNCFLLLDSPEKGGIDIIGALDQSVALKFTTHKDVLQFAQVDIISY